MPSRQISNHNSIRIDKFKDNNFFGTTFAIVFVCRQFFYLYCNFFDGSSIIIFIMHAIELSSRDWMISFSSLAEKSLHMVIIVSNVTTKLIFYWVLFTQNLWWVCQRHPCAADRLISLCCRSSTILLRHLNGKTWKAHGSINIPLSKNKYYIL